MKALILGEVNVHELELISPEESDLVKRIKPDFKKLGPRFGKQMKAVANIVSGLDQDDISNLERNGSLELDLGGETATLSLEDVEISTSDLPGWSVASDGNLTVALDITLTEALRMEGIARELVSKVQQLRKGEGFEVTDRIELIVRKNGNELFERSIQTHAQHILDETLAINDPNNLLVDDLNGAKKHEIELMEGLSCVLNIAKHQ